MGIMGVEFSLDLCNLQLRWEIRIKWHELNKQKKFRRHHVFFPVAQKRKTCASYKKYLKNILSLHILSFQTNPSLQNKVATNKNLAKSSPSGWTQCWWQEVSLMWFCPWPVEETMEWPYASFQPCVSVSLVLFLGPNFSARENTGKSNDLDFVYLFGGWIWQKYCFIGVMCWCRYIFLEMNICKYAIIYIYYVCLGTQLCFVLVFGAGMNVGIEWWMYHIVESCSILKWKQTAIPRVLTLIGMYTFFNSTQYMWDDMRKQFWTRNLSNMLERLLLSQWGELL